MEFVKTIIIEFWNTTSDMSVYLLFGFFVAGIISIFISQQVVERHLGGRGIWPVLKASLFGVPLPLCSCGVIPVSVSLHKHGASKGSTVAFLLSTPQTGVDSMPASIVACRKKDTAISRAKKIRSTDNKRDNKEVRQPSITGSPATTVIG